MSRIWNRIFRRPAGPSRPARRRAHRPFVERLEQHCLLSTFTVTTTEDAGRGSLRQAILDANAEPGPDVVDFAIAGEWDDLTPAAWGVQTIRLRSALPDVTDPLTIDGFSQPRRELDFRYDPRPMIELDGSAAAPAPGQGVAHGLRITSTASGSVAEGLIINRFTGSGIVLDGGSNNVVRGCYIGTDVSGSTGLGNGGSGIRVQSSPYNSIGGANPGDRNVISANGDVGVRLTDGISSVNRIVNNDIGLDATGTRALGNRLGGVVIAFGQRNAVDGNLISANGHALQDSSNPSRSSGVFILGATASENLITGNLIGTDATGTHALGNDLDGVQVQDAPRNTIVGNVVSGNGNHGIGLYGDQARGNVVKANRAGTNAAGTAALPNYYDGVAVVAPYNTIVGNLLSGNTRAGLYFFSALASNNVARGNLIGTDADGTAALGNGFAGVVISGSAAFNVIGGSSPGDGNTVSGNNGFGILITDYSASNWVAGNRIGIGVDDRALGNALAGVSIRNWSNNNLIGGYSSEAGNTIAYNRGPGVEILSGVDDIVVGNVLYANGG